MGLRDVTWFDVLRRNAELRPEGTALLFEGRRITHRELFEQGGRLAAGLAGQGVGPGSRIGLLAQNTPDMLALLAAAACLGAILLPVNWRLGAGEVAANLADGDPAIVVVDVASLPLVSEARDALPSAAWFILDGEAEGMAPFASLLGGQPFDGDTIAASDDPLVIIHTAAVDGRPRGAVLTHGNLLAQNSQAITAWGLGPDDVALGFLPFFHISGLGLATALAQAGGAIVVQRRFDADEAAAFVSAERVTVMYEFAPILGQILDAAERGEHDLSSLKAVWGLDSPETIARFEAACPGATFWAGYGQSETSGFVTFAPHRDRPGSAGRLVPMARVAILDEDDRPVTPGIVGEIAVRGPLVFAGYWNLPAETEWCFRNGWHHTGDMGRFDPDGYLIYAGRSPAKDLIKTGGENVYPAEVERVLREHPTVAEVVVVGVPDARWGEAVVAVCETRSGETVDAEALIAFVGERIARYKRPKRVEFVAALPRLNTGKPDRAAVKEMIAG